jgi:hypothetical protein
LDSLLHLLDSLNLTWFILLFSSSFFPSSYSLRERRCWDSLSTSTKILFKWISLSTLGLSIRVFYIFFIHTPFLFLLPTLLITRPNPLQAHNLISIINYLDSNLSHNSHQLINIMLWPLCPHNKINTYKHIFKIINTPNIIKHDVTSWLMLLL